MTSEFHCNLNLTNMKKFISTAFLGKQGVIIVVLELKTIRLVISPLASETDRISFNHGISVWPYVS